MSKKEKAPKQKKEKKPKVVEDHGITGMGTDYRVYILSKSERTTAFAVGAAVGFLAAYLYFDNIIIGIIVGAIAAIKAQSIYANKLLNKRGKELRLQFRDLLESLSNSYTVGMTATRAFRAALEDMKVEHGENSYIVKELDLICTTHENQGIEIKDMLNDFAKRSGLDDARSFAGVFDVSTNLGGDVAKVIRETRDMISDKIEIELEIQTMVTGEKNQLNILAIMPFVIALLMKSFNMGDSGALVIIVKIIAAALFVFAYWLGTKITDIKV
ncbi:MAG: hypothetical protein IJ129_06800 [Ruminococcus sp.]|nr:hypothetical protein [Ruminococcus sp.]